MSTPVTRRPINRQTIVIYPTGVNKGLFGRGEYVSLIDVREACERKDCPDTEDHYTFDGQVFYKKKLGKELE